MATIDEYVNAREAFVKHDALLDRMTQEIDSVANALRESRHCFQFSNTGVGFPLGVGLNPRVPTANGDNWRSATQINEALSEWHNKRDSLEQIWSAMTSAQKAALQPPPNQARIRVLV